MADTLVEVKLILSKFATSKDVLTTAGMETDISKELGVSSMNLVDVLLEFEDTFNVSITDAELMKIATIGDAVRIIDQKKQAV